MAGQLSRLCLLRPHLVLQRPSAKSRGIGAKFVFPPKNLRRSAITTQSECYTRVLWKLHYIFRGLLLPIGLSSQNFDTVIIMLCLYIRAEQKYFKNPSLLPLCIESCSSNQNKQSNGCCKKFNLANSAEFFASLSTTNRLPDCIAAYLGQREILQNMFVWYVAEV